MDAGGGLLEVLNANVANPRFLSRIAGVTGRHWPPPPHPGGDVGPEEFGFDCASEDSLMVGYFPPPSAVLALLSTSERRGGPRAIDDESSAFCAFDTCTRDATADEGQAILQEAYRSGEWRYTQGGARGGAEPPKDIPTRFGDCTDLTWHSTKTALGSAWPHSWAVKIATVDFHQRSAASLAAVGYRRVPADSARAGDIVVRGGHAGVFIGFDDSNEPYIGSGVWGWANNGYPAKVNKPNRDDETGWYNFSSTVDDQGHPVNPEFFRALVVIPCP